MEEMQLMQPDKLPDSLHLTSHFLRSVPVAILRHGQHIVQNMKLLLHSCTNYSWTE